MAINVADNFSYKGSKPLDARVKYDTVALMKAAPEADLYIGIMAYVAENKKYYVFDASNPTDATTGKWREFESGGGASAMSDLTDVELTDIDDGQILKYDAEEEKFVNADEKSYTAGDGIVIENDEISTDNMSSEDMDEIVTPLPSVSARYHKYSTDEQIVGEWIDGKPIYEKTIQDIFPSMSSDSATSKDIDFSSLNIDNMVGYNIIATTYHNDNNQLPLAWTSENEVKYIHASFHKYDHLSKPNILSITTNRATFGGCSLFITIRYTKTTD